MKLYFRTMMNKNATLNCKAALLTFVTVIVFSGSFFAQPREPSMCIYLENSEKVFVGSFQKQKKKTNSKNEIYFVADFSIQRDIKGLNQNEDKVSAISGLFAKHLKVNETYLVFLRYDKTKSVYEVAGSFPVTVLDNKSLNAGNQPQKLSAESRIAFTWLPGAHDGNFEKFKVMITANGVKYAPKFTNSGIFTLVFASDAKVSVSIEIPVEAVIDADGNPGWTSEIVGEHTVIKYNLEKLNCVCDYKKFTFLPY